MLDPSEIYEVDPQVAGRLAELSVHLRDGGPVLLHAIRGFVDAGSAGQIAAEHIRGELDSVRLATFDVDQLLDYRSRRTTSARSSRPRGW